MQDMPSQKIFLHAYIIIKAFITDKQIQNNQIDLKYRS